MEEEESDEGAGNGQPSQRQLGSPPPFDGFEVEKRCWAVQSQETRCKPEDKQEGTASGHTRGGRGASKGRAKRNEKG
eukprot:NODE_8859_length_340_cov_4.725086_g7099_i0.p4 GENE.NODE_8859_length_340_cov_4.725086_g7099_i0~~NODE_8859_length_340_cov_4.725086_g7099_i0.p4  ORF type:complete len:77 (-),score=2.95 NODE_8859_length_340_cov_4.725086_g7099_i0:12-242(-)